MAEPWEEGGDIQLEAFDGYYGEKPRLDGVVFRVIENQETAYQEFQAGRVDFTAIPFGKVLEARRLYGESRDGLTVEPGGQLLLGPEWGIYALSLDVSGSFYSSPGEYPLDDPRVRRALSLAIDRESLAQSLFAGGPHPASNLWPEVMPGFLPDAWHYTRYDLEQARLLLEEAGYPNPETLGPLILTFPEGSGQREVMQVIVASLAELGVEVRLNPRDRLQYLAGTWQMGPVETPLAYPSADALLHLLLHSGGPADPSRSSGVDAALRAARGIKDAGRRTAAYQELNLRIGRESPLLPLLAPTHHHVGAKTLRGFVLSPVSTARLERVWIEQS
jgi:ABC-type transport system substrate-binding protein